MSKFLDSLGHDFTPSPGDVRTPPNSLEAEQGLIGCILLSADCLDLCDNVFTQVFWDVRHHVIWPAILELRERNIPIGLIELQQLLKDRNKLQDAGGLAYLASLSDVPPSAANIQYYLDIVLEKYRSRLIILECQKSINKCYEFSDSFNEVISQISSDLTTTLSKCESNPKEEILTVQDLMEYNFKSDPNCVIGWRGEVSTRYLCRGQSAFLIGPSGVGKSSLGLQQAICFALGIPFFGVSPGRARRVLYIQAENDIGDTSEMFQGIIASLGIKLGSGDLITLHKHLKVVTNRRTRGEGFCRWLARQIKLHKAEIVFVDPFFSFAGIDVTKIDEVSKFLRDHLNPVIEDSGIVLILAHHTGKTGRDSSKKKEQQTVYDAAYAGIGSSEMTNWARATMLLTPIDDGKFILLFAKRGSRAWARHPNEDYTTVVYINHGDGGIFWSQIDPPEEQQNDSNTNKGGRKSKIEEIAGDKKGENGMNLNSFFMKCKREGEGQNEIARRLESWLAKEKYDVSPSTCKSVIKALVSNGKLIKNEESNYVIGKTG